MEIDKEIGNKPGEQVSLQNIGTIYNSLGDYSKAALYSNEALKMAMQIGDQSGVGKLFGNLGVIYMDAGDFPKAISMLEQAKAVQKQLGVSTMDTECNLGEVYLEQGDLAKAFGIFQEWKQPILLGRYYLTVGDYWKAAEQFARVAPQWR